MSKAIFYLSGSTIPSRAANSVHVMRMCQAFATNGHEVDLFAISGRSGVKDVYDFYGVREVFKVRRIARNERSPLRGASFPISVRKQVLRCSSLPDLFYARHVYSLWLLRNAGVPYIFEAHAPPRSRLEMELMASLFRHKSFTRLVVISQALKQIFNQLFPALEPSRVVVAHDGADPIDGIPRNQSTLTAPTEISDVGYVGHLHHGRGIPLILDLAKRYPTVRFHLIGGNDSEIGEWNAKSSTNVKFHGFVQPGELPEKYAELSVVLAPYEKHVRISTGRDTSQWMSPMKIFEYMAHAKPIIASDLPVLREVLVHRHNCLLAKAGDIGSWSQALEQLIHSPKLARLLGEQAETDLREKYTWQRRAAAVIENVI